MDGFSSNVAVVTGKDELGHSPCAANVSCVLLTLLLLTAVFKKRK